MTLELLVILAFLRHLILFLGTIIGLVYALSSAIMLMAVLNVIIPQNPPLS